MNSARIGRTVREMRAAGLKQLIVSSPSSVFYYTGKWVHPGERMLALLIRDSGDAARVWGTASSASTKPGPASSPCAFRKHGRI